jgi:hypothetical protein
MAKHGKVQKEKINPKRLARYERIFDLLDVDKGGTLSEEELRAALMHIGISISLEEVTQIASAADVDKDGQIDFAEFAKFLARGDEWDLMLGIWQARKEQANEELGKQKVVKPKLHFSHTLTRAESLAYIERRAMRRAQKEDVEKAANGPEWQAHLEKLAHPDSERKPVFDIDEHGDDGGEGDGGDGDGGDGDSEHPGHGDGEGPMLPFTMWVPAWHRWNHIDSLIQRESQYDRTKKKKLARMIEQVDHDFGDLPTSRMKVTP